LGITDPGLRALTRAAYIGRRQLNSGNPTWNALKDDFGQLGMRFQVDMDTRFTSAPYLRKVLDELVFARNAIVHADEEKLQQCRSRNLLWLRQCRLWRASLNRLVGTIDSATGAHLRVLTGERPW
jgi:hypothetical protein